MVGETIWNIFAEPLTQQAFQKALIGGSLVAMVCGVIGCFVILRRMAFLGDALSHSMLAGVTAGYLFMQIAFGHEAHTTAMMIGSILAGLVTVALISFVSRVSRIKEDTAIGIMYTGIFAIGGVLASVFSHRIHLDLYHFITGMVLGVEDADLWMMAVITAIVLTVVILLYRQLLIATFDPVMAASIGIPVVALDYLLTTCTSLVVVGAVSIVGVILVVGLLVTPAATAYLLSDRLHRMMGLSALFGVTGVIGGLYVSMWIGNVATGPSIVIVSTFQFLLILFFAPRYGLLADWLRRRSMIPQQTLEDILGCFRHGEQDRLPLSTIINMISEKPDAVHRALRTMVKQHLLVEGLGQITLTDSGRREAKRIARAHRLWETYLEQLGTPTEELHDRADRLEHLHDEETVDYLDDKLGHPLRDPHGSPIPEDFEHLIPGAEVKSSLLRKGLSGRITQIGPSAPSPLKVNMIITAGDRSHDNHHWTFLLPDGAQIRLNHEAADAIIVQLEQPDDGSS
ncbi:MAG: iron chelate uptake ABC transporter family permease subunit [Pirellulaceae bacterium]|nr:iron chelate uptake ABC transporter family permease subunit [Pirellulaceae bacterium]